MLKTAIGGRAESPVKVIVDLLTLNIFGIFDFIQVGYLGHFKELLEDALLQGCGTLQQTG